MKDDGRTVYSTGPGGSRSSRGKACAKCGELACRCEPAASIEPARQAPRVRWERAGRKGKTVTVIEPLILVRDEAAVLLAELKKTCGVGGTLKTGATRDGRACFVVELQGDHVDRIVDALAARGFAARRSGG